MTFLTSATSALALTIALASAPALAQQSGGSTPPMTGGAVSGGAQQALSAEDREFVTEAAADGMMEVQLGRMASERAEQSAVRQFGEQMVEDHSKANQQLQEIAQRQGMTLPSDLPAEKRQKVQQLSQLQGEAFDRAYVPMMVEDHQEGVELFRKEAQQGQNPALKNFAQENLPVLQQHLQMAQDLSAPGVAERSGGATSSQPGSPTTRQ